jgi:hypothetical protein
MRNGMPSSASRNGSLFLEHFNFPLPLGFLALQLLQQFGVVGFGGLSVVSHGWFSET